MPTTESNIEVAEWMNVDPNEGHYPHVPFIFAGGWDANGGGNESGTRMRPDGSRGVMVWKGSETDEELADLGSTESNDVPADATYLIQTTVLDDIQRQRYAETLAEAHEIGREEKAFVQDAPDLPFDDRHREAVRSALDYDDVFINNPPGEAEAIRLDNTTIDEGDGDDDYLVTREVAVEISGTLDLDVVMDSQGRLLYVDHDTGVEILLQGQRDNRCLLTLKETF